MRSPDKSVAGTYGLDIQAACGLQRLFHLSGIGENDVCIILLCLFNYYLQLILVVESLSGGHVLAKCIVGEEYPILTRVADHVIRPVHHRGQ